MKTDFSEFYDYAFTNNDGYRLLAADNFSVKQAVYEIRCKAYSSSGVSIDSNNGMFYDTYDEQDNCFSFLLTHNNKPVGSVRANHKLNENHSVGAMKAFKTELDATIDYGTFVESNRFVIDPEYGKRSKKPLLHLMRGISIHLKLTQASYIVGAVRKNHIDFYEKILKLQTFSSPKKYPGIGLEVVLLVGDMKKDAKRVFDRIPELSPDDSVVAYYAKQVGFKN